MKLLKSVAIPVIGLSAVALLAACSGGSGESAGSSSSPSSPNTSQAQTPSTATPTIASQEIIATNLDAPWGIAFLPDGSALMTERDTGVINRITSEPGGEATVKRVGEVSSFHTGGEGGLLGIAIAPGQDPAEAFVYYTTRQDNRIASMRWNGSKLAAPSPILTGIPSAQIHNGGRLAFGPDGSLYAGTGDAGDPDLAQDKSSLGGKILRITTSGKPAADNPFGDSPVFSLGHRNVQGLAFDSQGRLWNSEFGANRHDELNQVNAGSNYGWPIHEGIANDPKYADPYVEWPTSEASPSGLAIIDDWAYMAALRGKRLWQVGVGNPQPVGPNELLVGEYGRLRTPAVALDGSLWVTTSNTDGRANPADDDDKIIRLTLTSR